MVEYDLALARTGLIFTRIQEGAQPGGLTPPGQTEPGIPYHVLSCWVPVGGSWAAGTHLRLGSAQRQERLSGFCGLCCVFPLSISLLFLFPLFAVLLNCPYPDPPVSACFFPFSSALWRGEGQPRGSFVAGRSQTITSESSLLLKFKLQNQLLNYFAVPNINRSKKKVIKWC